MKYRPEIDGLRAIAILSVFIFHLAFKPSLLQGGFLGVDVFFVISGFLISTILFQQLEKTGTIDFKDFYLRRIKRILPSLLIIIVSSTFLAWFILLPKDFEAFSRSAFATLMFSSNFYFKKTDYFATSSDEFPLLHTWSLAIEEQFYIIWPLVAMLIWKLGGHKKRIVSILLLISASAAAVVYYGDGKSSAEAYFSPLTRAYELMLGAATSYLIYIARIKVSQHWWSWVNPLCILTLIISFLFVNPDTSYIPGTPSLVVCIATCLLIIGTFQTNGWAKKALSFKFLTLIGQHSYSLYLWHWPLIAFYRYTIAHDVMSPLDLLIYVLLSFGLAYGLRQWIELPIYKKHMSFRFSLVAILILPSAILLGFFRYGYKSERFVARLKNSEDYLKEVTYLPKSYCRNRIPKDRDCDVIKVGESAPRVVLIGDSHAGHYIPYLKEILDGEGVNFEARVVDSCPPILFPAEKFRKELNSYHKNCEQNLLYLRKKISQVQLLILAADWDILLKSPIATESFATTLEELDKLNIPTVLFARIPTTSPDIYEKYLRHKYSPWIVGDLEQTKKELIESFATSPHKELNQRIQEKAAPYKNIHFVDPLDGVIHPFIDNDIAYKDATHLNEFGSRYFGRKNKKYGSEILCNYVSCSRDEIAGDN